VSWSLTKARLTVTSSDSSSYTTACQTQPDADDIADDRMDAVGHEYFV